MKLSTLGVILGVGALSVVGSAAAVHADTVVAGIGSDTAAPSAGAGQTVLAVNLPDPNGSAGYSANGNLSATPPTLNYYASQYNTFVNGQTFTTGSNPGGYAIDSISVYDQWEQAGAFPNGGTMDLNVFVPNASSMLFSGSATVGTGAGANGSWVQYQFSSPLMLAANTTYAFSYQTQSGFAAMGFNVGNGTGISSPYFGNGTANEQLATFSSLTSTAPTYWTGDTGWGKLNNSAPVSGNNDPTDVFTDNASFEVIGSSVVPEPTSYLMMGAGMAGAAMCLRRRRA